MPVAFVLISAEVGRIDEVLDEVLKVEEISEAYSVAGPYAIVAKVETPRFEDLTKVIPQKLHGIKGITGTMTLLAFGVPKAFRTDACERVLELIERKEIGKLYEICRGCKQLKFCGYGARVVTYGF